MMVYWNLYFAFFKIGAVGVGGGYAMLSMIMNQAEQFSVTMEQLADMNALDMIVPGPIAINSATYVGYLGGGFWGALAATVGVMVPSFFIVTFVMRCINRYKDNRLMQGVLFGVKPAAVGLIAAAALTIAAGVLTQPGASMATLFVDPLGTVSLLSVAIFAAVAVANIRFSINPIVMTLLAGVVGAIFLT